MRELRLRKIKVLLHPMFKLGLSDPECLLFAALRTAFWWDLAGTYCDKLRDVFPTSSKILYTLPFFVEFVINC